jgi:hypothetical protein
VPQLGDVARVIEAVDPPHGYAVVLGGTETEFERGTYLNRAATLASFGVEDTFSSPVGVHGFQPFEPGRLHPALAKAGKWFAGGAAVLGLAVMALGSGTKITETVIVDTDRGGSLVFPLTRTDRLAEVSLTAGRLNNAWTWYDMELIHEESEETGAVFDGGMEYYTGYDSDGRWEEGTRTSTFRFKPPAAGAYRLYLETGDPGSARLPVTVEVREGIMLSRYLFWIAGFAALCWLSLWWRGVRFEARRWGTDEEDDD